MYSLPSIYFYAGESSTFMFPYFADENEHWIRSGVLGRSRNNSLQRKLCTLKGFKRTEDLFVEISTLQFETILLEFKSDYVIQLARKRNNLKTLRF